MSKKTAINRVQWAQVYAKISEVCRKSAEGFAIYDEGWSDQAVADAMPFACSVHTVSNTRAQVIGHLRTTRDASPAMEARVAALEARVATLEAMHALRPHVGLPQEPAGASDAA